MFKNDFGRVSSGNSNVQWNKKLAEELDAADGKNDGKISASIWNDFMKSTGSSGNKIKSFINLNNAERSLNFYDKKKDAGKVDWTNWESMLDNFKQEKGLTVEKSEVASNAASKAEQKAVESPLESPKSDAPTTPKADSKADPKATEPQVVTTKTEVPTSPNETPKAEVTEEQVAFDKLQNAGLLDDKPHTPLALKEAGFGVKPHNEKPSKLGVELYQQDENELYYTQDMNGGRTYTNAKGESIRVSESEAKLVEGGKVEVTYTSADGKTQNHIIYGENDKPIKGYTVVEGGVTAYEYTYDADGNKVLQKIIDGTKNTDETAQPDLINKNGMIDALQNGAVQATEVRPEVKSGENGKALEDTKNVSDPKILTENFKEEIMSKLNPSNPTRAKYYLGKLVGNLQLLNGAQKSKIEPKGTKEQQKVSEQRKNQMEASVNDFVAFIQKAGCSDLSIIKDAETGLYKLKIKDEVIDIPEREVALILEQTEGEDEYILGFVDET